MSGGSASRVLAEYLSASRLTDGKKSRNVNLELPIANCQLPIGNWQLAIYIPSSLNKYTNIAMAAAPICISRGFTAS